MFVHVNAATSADGKLSTRERRQVRISGDEDFARVDRLRAEYDAILVGVGTILADDPSLVRHDEAHREAERGAGTDPPARVVADTRLRTPPDAAILQGDPTTYVLHGTNAGAGRRETLADAGATLVEAGTGEDRVDFAAAFDALEGHGVESLLVEGGGEIIFSLFEAELVDRLTVYVGPTILGGRQAPTLADGRGFVGGFPELELTDVERLDDGVVLSWTVSRD
jgi:2,5-diamino-6-(ribosylamino)-4(3H)-pyrimidinone 5'-phosphate reductase